MTLHLSPLINTHAELIMQSQHNQALKWTMTCHHHQLAAACACYTIISQSHARQVFHFRLKQTPTTLILRISWVCRTTTASISGGISKSQTGNFLKIFSTSHKTSHPFEGHGRSGSLPPGGKCRHRHVVLEKRCVLFSSFFFRPTTTSAACPVWRKSSSYSVGKTDGVRGKKGPSKGWGFFSLNLPEANLNKVF